MVDELRRRPSAVARKACGPILSLCVVSAAASCSPPTDPLDYGERVQRRSVEFGGHTRHFLAYVPSSVSPSTPAPLVLVLHGSHQTAEEMHLLSWMNAVGEEEGVVVVHPTAAGDFWATGASPPRFEGVDDVGFLTELVRVVGEGVAIDAKRLYAVGFSNGGMMAVRLACQDRGRWAAVGAVAATIPSFWDGSCLSDPPLPAIFILGDRDGQFPFGPSAQIQGLLPAERTLPFWAGLNDCDDSIDVIELDDIADDGTTVERWTTPNCTGRQNAEFYVVRGGGHTWPGSPMNLSASLGRKSRDLDASRTLMAFFLQHPLP